jgi:hypothetical protein
MDTCFDSFSVDHDPWRRILIFGSIATQERIVDDIPQLSRRCGDYISGEQEGYHVHDLS